PDTGLTYDANGIDTNYSTVFVDGSESKLIRQLESSTGFSSEVISTANNKFSPSINLSGLNHSGETTSVFSGSELDDFIESENTDPVTLYGLSGDDFLVIWGFDGDGNGSTIYGGPGNDRLYGWDGNDTLYGGTGFDHFSGQRGNDTYYINKDSDGAELAGFEGFDVAYIPGRLEDYYFWGSEGSNFLSLKTSPSFIIQSFDMEQFIFEDESILTSEIDLYKSLPSQNELVFNLHDYLDVVLFSQFDHSIKVYGGVAHNNIDGTSKDDVIDGGGGNDDLWGQGGDDIIYGGYGDDRINGGDGKNVDVTQVGNITTYGKQATGILAQSIGGGGGNAGFDVASNVTKGGKAGVYIGREGGTGGDGGVVTVNHDGAIITKGDTAYGILAQSLGNGGGNSGFTKVAATGADPNPTDTPQGAEVAV
ncbi:MAG: hypothetical protein EBT93_15255, partial [Alphaproteobacteria bacterium]|nr:hypothetical protein [Alphaproteobacteria bacterium]